eukprot:scaffold5321_cov267-Pinguiococcus_pyrenoidosus.AAC.2
MPWDALTIGNHELYRNDNIDFITSDGGWIDSMGDRYLTANVAHPDGTPFGFRYKVLEGAFGSRVLTFGFLYNMRDADSDALVKEVADVVEEAWFTQALQEANLDSIVVLSHMPYNDNLEQTILSKIRGQLGGDFPVLFVSGHSHQRRQLSWDAAAYSFEAGNYLNTIGFASVPKASSFVRQSSEATDNGFAGQYIDPNVDVMASVLGLPSPDNMTTPDGAALSAAIMSAQLELGVLDRLGCNPLFYRRYADFEAEDSLWRLYADEVIPEALFEGDTSKVLFQGTGSLRYDLYAGDVLVDDIVTMSPFADKFYLVATGVPGNDVLAIQDILNGGNGRQYIGNRRLRSVTPADRYGIRHVHELLGPERRLADVPRYIMSGEPQNSGEALYDVYTVEFDIAHVSGTVADVLNQPVEATLQFPGVNGTSVWYDYARQNWPCPQEGSPSSSGDSDGDGLSPTMIGVTAGVIAVAVLAMSAVVLFFVHRRRMQVSAPKSDAKEDETKAAPRQVMESDSSTLLENEEEPDL